MRIVKDQALAVLRQETDALDRQSQFCQREVNKFSSFCLQDMAGTSITAAEQRIRMRAAVAQAHLGFCRELYLADRRNEQLVQALPTTSPGVLDTFVAQERIDEANAHIRLLERNMNDALAMAQRSNARVSLTTSGGHITSQGFVDTSVIRQRYAVLIAAQKKVVLANEDILAQAEAYERAAADVYAAVSGSVLLQASESALSFAVQGSWGATTWAGQMRLGLLVSVYKERQAGAGQPVGERFLNDDLKVAGALFADEWSSESEFAGVAVCGAFAGSVAGYGAELAPFAKERSSPADKVDGQDAQASKKDSSYGVKAEVEAYAAQFAFDNDIGMVQLDDKTELIAGTLSASLGISPASGAGFVPSLEASAKAEGALASNTVKLSVGERDYNLHGKAEIEGLSASAKAGVTIGEQEGLLVETGAEAYLVSGELSGGFTFLGVDVDVAVEGNVGGAGAKAGLQGGLSSLGAELGLGLGVGAGVKLKVDWSGASQAIGDGWNSLEAWWNDMHDEGATKGEED